MSDHYVLEDGTTLDGPSARRLFDADATISRLTAEKEHLLATNDRLFQRAVAAELRVKELEKAARELTYRLSGRSVEGWGIWVDNLNAVLEKP